ncbi:uncharacterized protein CIMG_05071 [Coccidioides immitis RS]|uniref:Uncharacterized protein n=2 Tax=Coccidioides immitis TaxID=5501 RepID=A0A0E1RYM1_COCIM|nr:uncharacterized protein CIMG_05071 [Coccidioides immitis RS]EAS34047.1 hypothetical protein CIMG_05071 [Coccidioides immitis RS]KMP05266.1 hypothetical protein CIRG_04947 [Coccidioides immitis RMSCC 2394]
MNIETKFSNFQSRALHIHPRAKRDGRSVQVPEDLARTSLKPRNLASVEPSALARVSRSLPQSLVALVQAPSSLARGEGRMKRQLLAKSSWSSESSFDELPSPQQEARSA